MGWNRRSDRSMPDEISLIPLACAQFAFNGQPADGVLFGLVEDYLKLRTEGAALLLASSGFQRVHSAPGYLVKWVHGKNYYVPFNLASMFPVGAMLDEINDLLIACRLNESGNICLSGSATFLGKIASITDLDFCEYYFDDLDSAKTRVDAKAKEETLPCLFRVKSDAQAERRPFPNLEPFLAGIKLHVGSKTEFERLKLDYVAAPACFGPIAVTNLILSTDTSYTDSHNAALSFQYQEIAVCEETRQPHRSLIAPKDLGRYMNWLKDETKALTKAGAKDLPASGPKLVKALKRALSWYLVAGMEEPVSDIAGVLGHPVMVRISNSARSAELERMLKDLDRTVANELRQLAGLNVAGSNITADELIDFYNLAHALAENLAQEMDSLSVG